MQDTDIDLLKVAEVEIFYKTTVKNSLRPSITSSSSTVEILRKHWDENKIDHIEELYTPEIARSQFNPFS